MFFNGDTILEENPTNWQAAQIPAVPLLNPEQRRWAERRRRVGGAPRETAAATALSRPSTLIDLASLPITSVIADADVQPRGVVRGRLPDAWRRERLLRRRGAERAVVEHVLTSSSDDSSDSTPAAVATDAPT